MSSADRILNMIVRGVVKTWEATERGFNTLRVSLLADEPPDVHHFQPYGFASVPPEGANALVFQPSGNADHLIAIVAGRGPDLAEMETAVWNGYGWAVKLLENEVRIDHDEYMSGDHDEYMSGDHDEYMSGDHDEYMSGDWGGAGEGRVGTPTVVFKATVDRIDLAGLSGIAVVRNGDVVSFPGVGWFAQVTSAVNALAPGSITTSPSATVTASSTKVYAE